LRDVQPFVLQTQTGNAFQQFARRCPMRRSILILLLALLSLSVITCRAQKQEYVGQYDAYFGFAYLTTPNMNAGPAWLAGSVRLQLATLDSGWFRHQLFRRKQFDHRTPAQQRDNCEACANSAAAASGIYSLVALSREHLHHHGRSAVQLSRVQVGHAVYPSGPGRDVSKH